MTCVVPVLDSESGVMRARGTAFFVSDRGLLITARHVIDEKVPDDVSGGDHRGPEGHHYFVIVPSSPTEAGQADRVSLRVVQIALDPRKSDVAVMTVDMGAFPDVMRPSLKPWPLAHVRPTPGEECMVMGYADMAVGEPVDSAGGSLDVIWTQRLAVSDGRVGDLYTSGRDSGLAPHPCFEITIETTGGMSGGPVFTQAGLCGVLSAGANDAPYSLASFIATCYQLGIDCDFGDGQTTYAINDLVMSRRIAATGPRVGMKDLGDRYEILWPEEPAPPVPPQN